MKYITKYDLISGPAEKHVKQLIKQLEYTATYDKVGDIYYELKQATEITDDHAKQLSEALEQRPATARAVGYVSLQASCPFCHSDTLTVESKHDVHYVVCNTCWGESSKCPTIGMMVATWDNTNKE